ncbi:hypothetical protein E3N88_03768 [Mikania micrantha]|uniref:Apyrase n=1 Tax=Mikania micrantha TaxID=192012 RepID=A0A5N6PVA2_9ASTR|nr:hypothetical protein E3N88_03768 [Mikania micrantha]
MQSRQQLILPRKNILPQLLILDRVLRQNGIPEITHSCNNIEITLWGEKAKHSSIEDARGSILAVTSTTVTEFKGVLQLESTSATTIEIDPAIPELPAYINRFKDLAVTTHQQTTEKYVTIAELKGTIGHNNLADLPVLQQSWTFKQIEIGSMSHALNLVALTKPIHRVTTMFVKTMEYFLIQCSLFVNKADNRSTLTPATPDPKRQTNTLAGSFSFLSNARVAASESEPEAVDRPDIGKKEEKMDNSMKLKFRPNQSLRSSNLFSRNQKQQANITKLNVFVIGFVSLVFVSLCYFYLNSSYLVEKRYKIVIDGGSTGSRIHVFEYAINDGVPVFDFSGKNGLNSMRVSPGLSAFADDLIGAGESVLELLEFARKRIPTENWGQTEVRLMATGGLRMLDLGVQERILESCRKVLRSSGFAFRDDWAEVITGYDEGVYAWIVANYALGTLGGDPHETTGIIELGGASAQVTFFSSEPIPPEFSQTVKFGNVSYSLYSHSLLEFGQNVAFDLVRQSNLAKVPETFGSKQPLDPCSPRGYKHNLVIENGTPSSLAEKNKQISILHATGNFSECRSASLTLLQKGKGDKRWVS